ncbi:MAG: hypothetical protein DMG36_22660 [Acidobacteria bacterium]|nr:MAG: hypothetical protein DMG36_22660 [Acidobacteriota bacterium]
MRVGLIAEPWWVNLLLLVPPVAYFLWRRNGGLALAPHQLLTSGVFAAAFGFVEAVVVAYLRAATGLLPGYQGTLAEVMRRSSEFYQQSQAINQFPQSLLTLEVLREGATIVMLLSVAFLTAAKTSSRAAIFLWTFAIWDITYYAALWATVRWPLSLRDVDVLFLIPRPWISAVWFPLLVSALAIAAVLFARATPPKSG